MKTQQNTPGNLFLDFVVIFWVLEGILLFNFRSNFNATQTLTLRFGDLC